MNIDDLIVRALAARERAYAPYSKYLVGCALIAEGEVFEGANVENASHGLCICAERAAIAQAVNAGKRRVDTVVVASQSTPPAAPCGMCLQTIIEFADDPSKVVVISVSTSGMRRDFVLSDLLPHAFDKSQLDT